MTTIYGGVASADSDWQEKKGILTDLDTKITVKGVEKYIFNYKKEKMLQLLKKR